MTKKIKQNILVLLISSVMTAIYWSTSFKTSSEDFFMFIGQYFILFALFLVLIKIETDFRKLLIFAILSRVVLIFSVPELSPDFYRFIWDGELLTKGINPYAHLPNDLISFKGFYDSQYMRILYNGTTTLSQGHYSNYPVFNQIIFAIPAYFFESVKANVIGLKVILVLADIGVIFILKKILEALKLPVQKLWMYVLNPFILIEFVGNMHFEGVMIFFLLLCIYFLLKSKWLVSGTMLGLAVQIKLIPLMFLPFFFKNLKWRKSLGFLSITLLTVIIIGLLLWNEPVYFDNMMASIKIYFEVFQFNSSFFSVVNHFKSESIGWDMTKEVGPMMSKIATVCIILLAVFRNYKESLDVIKGMLFGLLIYYAFATTVHPWYVSMILVLTLFTDYKFGLVWTLLIPLSYGYYNLPANGVTVIWIEYTVLYGVIVYEIVKYWQKGLFNWNFKTFFSS